MLFGISSVSHRERERAWGVLGQAIILTVKYLYIVPEKGKKKGGGGALYFKVLHFPLNIAGVVSLALALDLFLYFLRIFLCAHGRSVLLFSGTLQLLFHLQIDGAVHYDLDHLRQVQHTHTAPGRNPRPVCVTGATR